MLNGDAVISFLGLVGHGAWSTFERAIEDVTGLDFHSYYAARALSSQALVEFDWLGTRSWSVPPLSVVHIGRSRFLATGVMDDETEEVLRLSGITIDSRKAVLTNRLEYTRRELYDPEERGFSVFESLADRITFEPSALSAGPTLLATLPQIGSIIDSRPAMILSDAIGDGEAHFLDRHALSFATSSPSQGGDFQFEMIRVRREFRPPEYYYVDHRGARRIELELALCYAAGRSDIAFVHHAGDTLAIRNTVPLPVLFARSLHLCGAYFVGFLRSGTNDLEYACFNGVSPSVARTLAMKLLTRVNGLPAGDHL